MTSRHCAIAVWAALSQYMADHDRPPTLRELGAASYYCTSAVHGALTELERQGYVHRAPARVSRGLWLLVPLLEVRR